jgi:hypothetical protein
MIPQYFLILLIPMTIAKIFSYSHDIILRKVKPNLSSWVIWFMANFVSLLGSLMQGVPFLDVSNTAFVSLSLLFVVALAIWQRQYYIDPTSIDKICFLLGIIGILLLVFVAQKNYAIGLMILVDFVACFPTFFKIWYSKNESENSTNFVISFFMAIINLLVLTSFSFANAGFTFYKLFSTSGMFISVWVKNHKLKKL